MNIDDLRAWGANVDEGLARCMNNEAFYLRLVGMETADKNFEGMRAALAAGDVHAAFEAAHAIKGAAGNLALTPIYEPVCELTELLRGRTEPVEADALVDQIMEQREKARRL